MVENAVPVFRSEIGAVEADPQFIRHRLCVGKIFLGGAVLGAVVFLPVFHEQALDPVACFNQHEGCDGGIHSA